MLLAQQRGIRVLTQPPPSTPSFVRSTIMHWLRLDRISREKQASGKNRR